MKKVLTMLVVLTMSVCLFACGGSGKREASEEPAAEVEVVPTHHVEISIDCESNLMFSRYDVDVYLDDEKVGTISHGGESTFDVQLTEGQHELRFHEEGEAEAKGTTTFVTHGEGETFSYKIHCESDNITVKSLKDDKEEAEETDAAKAEVGQSSSDKKAEAQKTDDAAKKAEEDKKAEEEKKKAEADKKKAEEEKRKAEEEKKAEEERKKAEEEERKRAEEEERRKAEEAKKAQAQPAPEPEQSVPYEYSAALKQAKGYSDRMHMSRIAIYDQLTSEYGGQFPADAAQYAIDNLEADYYANALAKAQSYSDSMHMSKMGIYEQLTSEYGEQFTPDEAAYAVDNVNADFYANALEKARSYAEQMSMSYEDLYDQLVSQYGEQFTEDEAAYAIQNL